MFVEGQFDSASPLPTFVQQFYWGERNQSQIPWSLLSGALGDFVATDCATTLYVEALQERMETLEYHLKDRSRQLSNCRCSTQTPCCAISFICLKHLPVAVIRITTCGKCLPWRAEWSEILFVGQCNWGMRTFWRSPTCVAFQAFSACDTKRTDKLGCSHCRTLVLCLGMNSCGRRQPTLHQEPVWWWELWARGGLFLWSNRVFGGGPALMGVRSRKE